MNQRALLVAAAAGAVISCATVRIAAADTTATSSIAQIKVLESGDANYKLFRGAIWLDYDKAQYNYRWGGAHCKGFDLTDSTIQLLFASFKSEYNVTIDYVVNEYKSQQYRCITGFTVSKT
jgi:hypothetical protein